MDFTHVYKSLEEYRENNNQLADITKKTTDNKVCLETIENNLANEDHNVASAIKVLRENITKQKNNYKERVAELLVLETTIKDYQNTIVEKLKELLELNKMIVTTLDIKDHEMNILNAKCANILYNKHDNHDLRSEPPIHGVVFKEDHLGIDIQTNLNVLPNDVFKQYTFL